MLEIDCHGASSIRYLLGVVGAMGALIFASAASQNEAFKNIDRSLSHNWYGGGHYGLTVPQRDSQPLVLRMVR